jgi:hypothetical protein
VAAKKLTPDRQDHDHERGQHDAADEGADLLLGGRGLLGDGDLDVVDVPAGSDDPVERPVALHERDLRRGLPRRPRRGRLRPRVLHEPLAVLPREVPEGREQVLRAAVHDELELLRVHPLAVELGPDRMHHHPRGRRLGRADPEVLRAVADLADARGDLRELLANRLVDVDARPDHPSPLLEQADVGELGHLRQQRLAVRLGPAVPDEALAACGGELDGELEQVPVRVAGAVELGRVEDLPSSLGTSGCISIVG